MGHRVGREKLDPSGIHYRKSKGVVNSGTHLSYTLLSKNVEPQIDIVKLK